MDFAEDQTESGTRFRVLTLIRAHTGIPGSACGLVDPGGGCYHGGRSGVCALRGAGVFAQRQRPKFIGYAIQDWLQEKNVKTIYITPGSPWENAYIESFHDKLRDECLNRDIFGSLMEARVVTERSGAWNTTGCGPTAR